MFNVNHLMVSWHRRLQSSVPNLMISDIALKYFFSLVEATTPRANMLLPEAAVFKRVNDFRNLHTERINYKYHIVPCHALQRKSIL